MKSLLAHLYTWFSNVWYRLRLRNDNFTIIADTCIAGVMYHKLGKKFLSPTINLWMHDEDLFKFVHNMDEYLALPLRFVKNKNGYPLAYCGDILIHFNHYKSESEAEIKWNERKSRINKDNLFIICADRRNTRLITYEDIRSLADIPCRGKVVFSIHQYDDIDYIVPLPKDENGDWVNIYMQDKTKYLQRWRWENAWDWVHWLNTGEVKVRKCQGA